MNRIQNQSSFFLRDLEIETELVELKEDLYRNSLLLATILELLIEKNIITEKEVQLKAADIDNPTTE